MKSVLGILFILGVVLAQDFDLNTDNHLPLGYGQFEYVPGPTGIGLDGATKQAFYSPLGEIPRLDGFGNNVQFPGWGANNRTLARHNVTHTYTANSGLRESPANERNISLLLMSIIPENQGFNENPYSDMLTYWGQFMDHDVGVSLTNGADKADAPMPFLDPFFDPFGLGNAKMPFVRSTFVLDNVTGLREQLNNITSFLDASVIYGSDPMRALAIRRFKDGELNFTIRAGIDGDREFPPFNDMGFFMNNAAQKVSSSVLYFFGDIRGNENVGVLAYHTLFIREHNRLARKFKQERPGLNDEQLYQLARKWVRAEFQAISETQYFPLIAGLQAVPPYKGYNPKRDPSIQTPFTGACFRYGHSEANEVFYRLDENRKVIPQGNARTENVFFDNRWMDFGIDALIRGMSAQRQGGVDNFVVPSVRNFLYGQPGAGGTDLVTRNIRRGRDHGLGTLNQYRVAYGLPPHTSFADITSKPAVAAMFNELYLGNVSDVDLYPGALSEDRFEEQAANVGLTLRTILGEQYGRFRDGDRFWFDQPGIMFTPEELKEVRNLNLAKIVLLNTEIKRIQCNPFISTNKLDCFLGEVPDSASLNMVSGALVALLVAFAARLF